MNRRTRKLAVATEALKMAPLAALYEMAAALTADHPEAAVQIRRHILESGEIPDGFALAYEQIVDLVKAEE